MDAHTDVPKMIRQLRADMGLTQQELAVQLGVALPTISRWETGRAKPSPLALQKIEDALANAGAKGRASVKRRFPGRVRGKK